MGDTDEERERMLNAAHNALRKYPANTHAMLVMRLNQPRQTSAQVTEQMVRIHGERIRADIIAHERAWRERWLNTALTAL